MRRGENRAIMPTMRHVIIGNSAAAVGAVEAIRHHDQDNAITIVADEPHSAYSRPLITYLLGGMVTESQMLYRPSDFYERYEVEPMLGVKVMQVEPQHHQLLLAGGGALGYDRLLIATGGVPFVPSVPGGDLDGVFTFTRWEDARKMRHFIEAHAAREAVVVGGGFIGLKTTEGLLARGIKVTIIELADRILSASFDRTGSHLAETILRREGVEVRTGTTVQQIVGRAGKVDQVILREGERLECDLLVFAIGVRPNTALIPHGTEIATNRGVLVDNRMRTTAPDVFAAGDVAEGLDALLGVPRTITIWPVAYRQGHIAGCNMAGVDREYEGGIPMNSIEICSVPTISVGITDPQTESRSPGVGPANVPTTTSPPEILGTPDDAFEILEHFNREDMTYKKLVLHHDRLVGAVFIGNIDRAGIYTGLIRDRAHVGGLKKELLAENFGLVSLPRDYRKHLVTGEGIVV
jgi:nitrite reductase (NADH) large subunit